MLFLIAASSKASPLSDFVLTFLPIFLFLVILFFFFRRVQHKNKSYLETARAHMAAMEQKSDRIIELLEELNRSDRRP